MAEESDTHHLLQLVEAEHQMGEDADAVLRLGAMIMAAGTGGYRVIRAMKRAARALGFDRVEAVISVNNITCSFHKGELFRTIVVNRDNPAVDASRIEALENLSHHMGSSYTAEELHRELDQIEQRVGKRWPVWVQALAAGLACSGFAVLNHYPFLEAVVVALAAAVGQIVRHSCARRHLNQLGTTAMAAVVASLMYLFMAKGLAMVGIIDSPTFTTGYVASVLFLIPGFPLFSSLLDLSRFDLFSGLSRLCYATTVICTATMAATAVSLITGLQPLPPDPATPNLLWYLEATGATIVGIAGFAILFNSSRRMAITATTIGTVANMVRLVCAETGLQPQFAAFIGALVVGLLGALLTKRISIPRITITVPASVVMIPGTAIYRTVYYLNSGDIDSGVGTAASASLSIIAIGAGLVVARMLTDPDWTFGRHIDLHKNVDDR
ncbi:threonine/serine exporter family protein [Corynebacterium matruchotii]|uniref:threonine/serine ThrE exporter family protein n=1 Tax=Corynebacterium matruchotii TaxID=43768 RepID=UPI0028E28D09|nr:threonine/serine exporter family protein [Corynebacterium matruchotii]